MVAKLLAQPPRPIGCNTINAGADQPPRNSRVIYRPHEELQAIAPDLLYERLVHRPIEMQVQAIELSGLCQLNKVRQCR
jgi:hypothetical protein